MATAITPQSYLNFHQVLKLFISAVTLDSSLKSPVEELKFVLLSFLRFFKVKLKPDRLNVRIIKKADFLNKRNSQSNK